ncbi:hypothetical protein AAG589_09490 [Isoptericola sp. F-RaC21]|uniref:hypothetical protein n=1 Tax=Isoptericola sp. F-RaC21 TaxID=3141452 RepID=UPI00315C3888
MDRPSLRPNVRIVSASGLALVGLLAGCSAPTVLLGDAVPSATTTTREPTPDSAAADLCAVLPSSLAGTNDASGQPDGGYEGWFNSTPTDADGKALRDPAEWPDEMREHPRVALVNTWTDTVVASYDRVRCGEVDGWQVPEDTSDWPPKSVVVVDVSTGEVVEHFAVGRDG